MSYVALFYGNDGSLGPTHMCETWEEAVAHCVWIAKRQDESPTEEQIEWLREGGDLHFPSGNAVHIGALELVELED